MVFGCLRRCGMNSSDDDLVPYEKAPREIVRLESVSPLSAPTPTQSAPLTSPATHTPPRKMTCTIDQYDYFVPLLCSTKITGSTSHHRSVSQLGAEGSFHDMILHDRCRSLNHLDDRPGRLLRHDHYSTEKFLSTSTVIVDPSKIAGDRTRDAKEESVRVAHPIPLQPVIAMTRAALPMTIPSVEEKEEDVVSDVVQRLVTTTASNEEKEEKETADRSAIGELVKEIMNKMEAVKEEDLRDSEWRETPILNQTCTLSPIVEERKWKVYEDEDEKRMPISSTPLSQVSSKRINKLKIRDDYSPSPIDLPLKTPQEVKVLQETMTPQVTGERVDSSLMNAPSRLSSRSRLAGGITFNGSRVLFVRD